MNVDCSFNFGAPIRQRTRLLQSVFCAGFCDLRPALYLNSTSTGGAFTMDKYNNESGQLHLSNSDKSIKS